MAANGVAVTNKIGMSYQLPGVGCVGASSGETVTSFYLNPTYVSELLTRVAALGKSVEFLASTGYAGVWIGPVVDVDNPFETTGLGGEGYLLMPMCGAACDFAGGEVNPVGTFRPDAPKIKPVFGLVDAPDWVFVDSITSKPKRSKSKRSKREPIKPEPVTAEIPEVPPQTEPHEVVATSSAIIVRKVVIPGGKSVKELADVFGGFKHKPRGFRDSKGRRVAYVAFDGTGGVIAYRDYYTDVDTRLEQDIADYLASHNLKLAA